MSRQLKAAIAFGNFVVGTAHGIFPAARKHVGCLAASSSQRLVSDLFSSACCNLQSNSLTNTVPSCRSCNTNSSCNSSNSFFFPVLAATVRCSGRLGQVIKLRASRRESPYVRVPTSQPARDLPRVGSSLGSAPVWKKMSLEHIRTFWHVFTMFACLGRTSVFSNSLTWLTPTHFWEESEQLLMACPVNSFKPEALNECWNFIKFIGDPKKNLYLPWCRKRRIAQTEVTSWLS